MGYNIEFKGAFQFNKELDSNDMRYLEELLEKSDYRKFNETLNQDYVSKNLTFLNLELTVDRNGVQWDSSEKSHSMDSALNLITILMQRRKPGFKLIGEMFAQGDELGDVFKIIINKDGYAEVVELAVFHPHHECTWNLTPFAEEVYGVESSCGEAIELDYMLILEFTYCPFCADKINKIYSTL